MRTLCLLGMLTLVGCGDDDAARDAGADSGSDAGRDAGTDARSDAGSDAAADAGTDSATMDAATEEDAAGDAGPRTIACGTSTCVVGDEVCCRESGGTASCATECEGGEIEFACDGPEDCDEGICCRDVLSGEGGAVCAATCEGAFVPACHPGEMCDDDSLCCPMGVCLGGGCD